MVGSSIYNSPFVFIWIEQYINSLPFWRRILARHFEKYKVTPKEFEEWFFKRNELN